MVADGETEATVLLPRRDYTSFWHRWLHDRTADRMAAAVSDLPHANVTIVPFHLGQGRPRKVTPVPKVPKVFQRRGSNGPRPEDVAGPELDVEGAVPIGDVQDRQRVRIAGRVHALRVQPWSGQPTLECTVTDGTGRIVVVFLGRRRIAGIEPGARIVIDGIVGQRAGQRVILNPEYRLLPGLEATPPPKARKR